MHTYQRLENFTESMYGELRHGGIEYDFEVPDNMVVGTPGGVSSIHHHYTKGFYGAGNTSSDVYAGQQERYNQGVYGNMYEYGHTAAEKHGYYPQAPDYQFWRNKEPAHHSGYHSSPQTFNPYTDISKTTDDDTIEGFASDIEILEPSDEVMVKEYGKKQKRSAWLLFALFVLAFITMDLWSSSAHSFIVQFMNRGAEPSWKLYTVYAVFASALFTLIVMSFGIPLSWFEQF